MRIVFPKNKKREENMKNKIRKIIRCAVLIAICFGVMGCNLNANSGNSGTEEAKILTGACGETAETEGVEVLPLNGNKYYFKEEYYYRYPDYAPQDFKDRIKNEKLFREIVADRWNEWIVGTWGANRVFTKDGEYIYNGNRGGKYEINTTGAYYYYENVLGKKKDILLSVIPKTKYYYDLLFSNGVPTCVDENGIASLQSYNEFVSKEYQLQ